MDIEFLNDAILVQERIIITNPVMHDSSILQIRPPSQTPPISTDRILETPQQSRSSQPKLTLALVTPINTAGRFSFNSNSETELSEPLEEFQDAQNSQLSPTFSEHDIQLDQPSTSLFIHKSNQLMSPQTPTTQPLSHGAGFLGPATPQHCTRPTQVEIAEAHDNELV